jgi:hypothetical protein
MLAAQLTDHHHGGGWLVHEIPALIDLLLYALFEFLFCYEVIDQRMVEEHRL